jgi:hypothetical protein
MNRVGFKGFARPVTHNKAEFDKQISRMAIENLFIYYTGGSYKARAESARSQSLATVTEVAQPIPVAEFLHRAAICKGKAGGFPANIALQGLALHQVAKPCVFLMLERNDNGDFVAAKPIPTPDPARFPKDKYPRGIARGTVIVPKGGRKQVAKVATPAPAPAIKVKGKGAVVPAPAPKVSAPAEAAGNKPGKVAGAKSAQAAAALTRLKGKAAAKRK